MDKELKESRNRLNDILDQIILECRDCEKEIKLKWTSQDTKSLTKESDKNSKDSSKDKLVFNRTVTLRDPWAKIRKAGKM